MYEYVFKCIYSRGTWKKIDWKLRIIVEQIGWYKCFLFFSFKYLFELVIKPYISSSCSFYVVKAYWFMMFEMIRCTRFSLTTTAATVRWITVTVTVKSYRPNFRHARERCILYISVLIYYITSSHLARRTTNWTKLTQRAIKYRSFIRDRLNARKIRMQNNSILSSHLSLGYVTSFKNFIQSTDSRLLSYITKPPNNHSVSIRLPGRRI